MRSFVVSVWDGIRNVAAVSTSDKVFADKLKKFAEQEGYRVEFEKDSNRGPQHQ